MDFTKIDDPWKCTWEIHITPDFSVAVRFAPNWFWRWTQWMVLGFKYTRLDK